MSLTVDVATKMAYALGIGVLIGLERSLKRTPTLEPATAEEGDAEPEAWPESGPGPEPTAEDVSTGEQLMGVRTYTVLSLAGFGAALLGAELPIAAGVLVAGLVTLVIVMYMQTAKQDPGITTEVAAIACCGLGSLCYWMPHTAGVIAVLITVLLAMKRFTHTALSRLRRVELTDTLKFLIIILIVWPLLPNRALDPYGAFNPHKVVLLVILISGISFVGYFLTKFLGASRGLGLTGLLGGLTSSTAVTAAMSNQAKARPTLIGPCTLATIIANATMFARVLVVVYILDRKLGARLAPSIGTMTVVALIAVVVLWIRTARSKSQIKTAPGDAKLENPFSLGPAIKFAVFFVAILFVAKLAKEYLGNEGLYLAALASGLADVDAITLSVAEQTKDLSLAANVGAIAITIAVIANSVVKSGIALYSGGLKFGRQVGIVLLGATLAGLAVLLVA